MSLPLLSHIQFYFIFFLFFEKNILPSVYVHCGLVGIIFSLSISSFSKVRALAPFFFLVNANLCFAHSFAGFAWFNVLCLGVLKFPLTNKNEVTERG